MSDILYRVDRAIYDAESDGRFIAYLVLSRENYDALNTELARYWQVVFAHVPELKSYKGLRILVDEQALGVIRVA